MLLASSVFEFVLTNSSLATLWGFVFLSATKTYVNF